MHPAYVKNILSVEIKRNGKAYIFKRQNKNEFGEYEGEYIEYSLSGIYHTQTEYLKETVAESAKYHTRKKPCIMFVKDLAAEQPKKGDTTIINGLAHKVTGVQNVGELEEILDISLEVVNIE